MANFKIILGVVITIVIKTKTIGTTTEVEGAEGVVAEDLLEVIFHEITFDKITIVILMIHPTGITITVQ